MSNINKPVKVSPGVEVAVADSHIKVEGALGELERDIPGELKVRHDKAGRSLMVERIGEERRSRVLQGLYRTLIENMIVGVSKGFEKALEIHGTGYNVNLKGNSLALQVGFNHAVVFEIPKGLRVEVTQNAAQPDKPAKFVIKGADKALLGQFAANVREARPPEPYKGKGIRYVGEYVRRKEGKAFVGTER